jgi:hypothetical protein
MSSLQWRTTYLVRMIAKFPVLVMLNYRPEYAEHWTNLGHHTALVLKPLNPDDTETLVALSLGVTVLPEGLCRLINTRTVGNPLFVEEVCRSLIEDRTIRIEGQRATLTRRAEELVLPDTGLEACSDPTGSGRWKYAGRRPSVRRVAHRFNMMPVRVHHEGAIVVRVVVRSQPRRSPITTTRSKSRRMELANGLSRWCSEGHMKARRWGHQSLRRRVFEADVEREALRWIRVSVQRPVGYFTRNLQARGEPKRCEGGVVEYLRAREVVHAERDVVDGSDRSVVRVGVLGHSLAVVPVAKCFVMMDAPFFQ